MKTKKKEKNILKKSYWDLHQRQRQQHRQRQQQTIPSINRITHIIARIMPITSRAYQPLPPAGAKPGPTAPIIINIIPTAKSQILLPKAIACCIACIDKAGKLIISLVVYFTYYFNIIDKN